MIENEKIASTKLPAFRAGATIPLPLGDKSFFVFPRPADGGTSDPVDGVLGPTWFSNRIWTLDYLRHEVTLWRSFPAWKAPLARTHLAFKTQDGHRMMRGQFPRINIIIAGQTLPFLLDTGANVSLTNGALQRMRDRFERRRATSFMIRSLMQRLHEAHPHWPYIANAVLGWRSDMLQVPSLSIAGLQVGPVWFTSRPDRNFTVFMSQFMDKPVVGSLGGSALQYCSLTLDYPASAAYFSC